MYNRHHKTQIAVLRQKLLDTGVVIFQIIVQPSLYDGQIVDAPLRLLLYVLQGPFNHEFRRPEIALPLHVQLRHQIQTFLRLENRRRRSHQAVPQVRFVFKTERRIKCSVAILKLCKIYTRLLGEYFAPSVSLQRSYNSTCELKQILQHFEQIKYNAIKRRHF